MRLGVTRKYLYVIMEELKLFEKPNDRNFYYSNSGYSKKRNKKNASLNIKEFIKIFEESLKKK